MTAPCSTPATGVVVTGGASGIGLATATALAEVGRPVALWDLQADLVNDAAARLADEFGIEAAGIAIDVTDDGALDRAVADSVETIGSISGMVHAAGIVRAGGLDTDDLSGWDAVLAVNLRAMATVGRAVLPHLRAAAGGASIVGIASIEALVGHAAIPSYCASKSGMLGLVRSMAGEFGPEGIRVNAICPGFIRTPMLAPTLEGGGESTLVERAPLGRLGEPEEIGRIARFLLSDDASYVTGTELVADGGLIHQN